MHHSDRNAHVAGFRTADHTKPWPRAATRRRITLCSVAPWIIAALTAFVLWSAQ